MHTDPLVIALNLVCERLLSSQALALSRIHDSKFLERVDIYIYIEREREREREAKIR